MSTASTDPRPSRREPAPEVRETIIHLIRHAPTALNADGRLQGWSDAALLPEGERLANRVGEALRADGIDTSTIRCADTGRHVRTAEFIAGAGVRPRTDPRLREMSFGIFEGLRADEAWERAIELAGGSDEAERRAPRHGEPGFAILPALDGLARLDPSGRAETGSTVARRALRAIDEFSSADESGIVLAVTSGITIISILTELGLDPTLASSGIAPCSITTLARRVTATGDDATWSTTRVNDTAHLA